MTTFSGVYYVIIFTGGFAKNIENHKNVSIYEHLQSEDNPSLGQKLFVSPVSGWAT
jgi:hypothetical protein